MPRVSASRWQRAVVSSDFPVMTRQSCCLEVPAWRANPCLESPRSRRSISSCRPRGVSSGTPAGERVKGSAKVDIGYMKSYIPSPNIARSSATFVAHCKSRKAGSSSRGCQCRSEFWRDRRDGRGREGGRTLRLQRQDESIMIARHEVSMDKMDIWARIAAPVAPETIFWRQDGRAVQRDGKYVARFVAYIEANTVRERLDEVVPGEWDLTLELLPAVSVLDDAAEPATCSFKARLQILGVIREDIGTGKDYKQAATDAFKRAAVRFGIAHELYSYEQNWVEVDGDGKYARPVEDPQVAYDRRISSR